VNYYLTRHFIFLSDVASSLGVRARDSLAKPYVQTLLMAGQSTGDESIMQTVAWASAQVRGILQA